MNTASFEKIWCEQCKAARTIQLRFGHESAFDYLVGEKLLNYVSTASHRPEFAKLLPAFIGEVRDIFPADAIGPALDALEARLALKARQYDDLLPGERNIVGTDLQALRQISDLLRVPTLGTA